MAWTEAQKKVIDSRNESLLVSAAAGSGKTSVLVERVTQLLREGAELSRMLIVTFTNAAAGEMKERIANTLGASYVRHSHICTFHKFAIDVIQQYYHIIGVNPAVQICDEYNQSILKNEALDEMFEELFEAEDAGFIDFLNCYCSAKSNQNAKEMILAFHNFLESLPNPEAYAEAIKDGSAFEDEKYLGFLKEIITTTLRNALSALESSKELLLDPSKDLDASLKEIATPCVKLAEKVATDYEELKAIYEKIEADGVEYIKLLSDFSFMRMVATKAEKPSYGLIEDKFKYIRKIATDAVKGLKNDYASFSIEAFNQEKEAMKKPLASLVSLTNNFTERYQAKKRASNLFDFSDIEHFALKILEDENVCQELRDSFDYIFVDEYQDSNLVQDELISRISRKDNVFMVGDVKQSIYKFRLAEPELFLSKYDSFKSGKVEKSTAIDLNSNFRSKAPVIEFINKVFERIMTKNSVGLEYDDDAALKEGAPYAGDKLYKPELYLLSTKSMDGEELDPEIEELKDAELEALSAVKIIQDYHGKLVYDSKKGLERPLEYKDMVILLRATKSKGELFYRALEDAGIPVYLERGEGYFDTPEIQVLLNLLRIIDNFRQDVPLISVLHFPSFGFSADELANIRIFSRGKGLRELSYSDAFKLYAAEADGPLKTRCEEFLNTINFLRQKSKAMPLADFIWDVLCESGIGDFARALPMGVQRYANLRALADKAENFEAQNGGGLYGFISYIEAISGDNKAVETGQVTVLSEGADTVRIMTIHKSKGLEFPFVLLAGLGSKFMGVRNILHLAYHKDFGAAIRLVEPLKGLYTDPLSLSLINEKKSLEEYAEVIRVLYVAMTRAKDILVMSAAVKDAYEWNSKRLYLGETKRCKNYLDMIGPSLESKDIKIISLSDIGKVKEPQEYAKELLASIDNGFAVDPAELPVSEDELKERIFYDYSSKAEDNLKHKYSVSEIAELTRGAHENTNAPKLYEESFAVPLFVSGKLPLNAAAKGTAYHKIMEHIPFTLDGKASEDIKTFIASLKERNLLTEDEITVVEPERIAAFFESEIGKRACASKELYKEKPFVLKTMFEGREVIVQGTIDCFFEEDGQYVLVDYKSNYINKESLEKEKQRMTDEYVPQLALYKEALEKLTGKTVKEAVLYLFGINDIIKIC